MAIKRDIKDKSKKKDYLQRGKLDLLLPNLYL